jgi:hypothetical protein
VGNLQSLKTPYRLIWFQHLHKAAGSSIVSLAQMNGERLYPVHRNGIPIEEVSNRGFRFGKMSDDELSSFVDNCQEMGVSFVASEWSFPDYKLLVNDQRVFCITCLRDPLYRFLSNFYFAWYNGTTDCPTPFAYVNSKSAFTMFNYYCRVFSRLGNEKSTVSRHEYRKAQHALSQFDSVTILEHDNTFSNLKRDVGWVGKEIHKNRMYCGIFAIIRLIIHGQKKELLRRLFKRKFPADPSFIEYFNKNNTWDRLLYTTAAEKFYDISKKLERQ